MRFFKICLAAIVTGNAEGRIFGFEEIGFIRTVGEMARVARSFLQYPMNHFLFIILPFVALIAHFTPFCLEQSLFLGRMRIVATGALSSLQRCVHHSLVQSYLFLFMAGVAHLIASILEQQFRNYTVP
jgi:hypothetical protein